jgi:hypothetical protein
MSSKQQAALMHKLVGLVDEGDAESVKMITEVLKCKPALMAGAAIYKALDYPTHSIPSHEDPRPPAPSGLIYPLM